MWWFAQGRAGGGASTGKGAADVSRGGPAGTDEGCPEGVTRGAVKGPAEGGKVARPEGRTGCRADDPPVKVLATGPPVRREGCWVAWPPVPFGGVVDGPPRAVAALDPVAAVSMPAK